MPVSVFRIISYSYTSVSRSTCAMQSHVSRYSTVGEVELVASGCRFHSNDELLIGVIKASDASVY